MTTADIVNATSITAVWRELGGDLPKRGRVRAFYRDGDNQQAVSLNDAKGCWYDHRDSVGGGILDLIRQVRGGTPADALRWLAGFTGFAIDEQPLSSDERREFVKRRRAASIAAEAIAHWRVASIFELNARKLAAIEAGHDEVLISAATLCNLLENGSTGDCAREFIRHRATDPAEVARLIMAGRECDVESRRVTVQAVRLLAAASEESRRAA